MKEIDESTIRDRVRETLTMLPENRYGLHVEDVHLVDGRWWVFLDSDQEPENRYEIWDALADIEQRLEEQNVAVTVAAA